MTVLIQDPTEKKALAHFLDHCLIQTYPPRQTFIRAGEQNDVLYYIIEGSVSVNSQVEGRGLVYTYLNQGEFIGEVGFFHELQTKEVDVKTRCRSTLASISYPEFRRLLKNELLYDAVNLLFIIGRQLATRLLLVSRNFCDLAFMDTEGRIARCLMDLSKEPEAVEVPEGTKIHVTRKELSRLVGCSREIAGKFLKDLETRQLIAIEGKYIVVFKAD